MCIGHDMTEVADLKPAEVIVRVERREKLACTHCESALTRAPVGDRVVAGGRFGSRLVGQLLIDKYDDGLPLHRQKQRLARLGLPVAVSTLADQITWAAELLTPLWWAARRLMLTVIILHLDGTGLPVLDRDKKTHKRVGTGKRSGTLWGYVGDETALYLYCSSGHKKGRTADDVGPEDFLADRKGYTVADASNIFDATFQRKDIIECGCSMHARRYFTKALDGGDNRAVLPIAGFKKLYDIEERIRDFEHEEKLKVRQEESKPVYDSLLHWCRVHAKEERPTSPLGKAANYLVNHHQALMRFLEDGRIPIDNGAVERLHVRAAMTRKAYLFAGSDAGGRRAAIAYTVLGSCRLAGVNPEQYLAEVLPRLMRGGVTEAEADQLLPQFWRDRRIEGESDRPTPTATDPEPSQT
jgi:transposase